MKFAIFHREEVVFYVVGVTDDTPIEEQDAQRLTEALSGPIPPNVLKKMSGRNVLYVERIWQATPGRKDALRQLRDRAEKRAIDCRFNLEG